MYNIKDKPTAIREIQKYLLLISQVDKDIVNIVVDGIYGDNTREAVRIFQNKNGLPGTGAVDLATFNLLFSQYLSVLTERDARDAAIKRLEYPLKLGESSNDLGVLNSYLRSLAKSYIDQPSPDSGDYFSATTERAVKSLQKRFGRQESGIVDLILLREIIREIDSRELINKIGPSV